MSHITLLLALLVCAPLFINAQSSSIVPTGTCFASRSTWFADNQHGACMYGPSLGPTGNGNFLIAASSMLVFNNSADCGACYQITSTNGASVIVTVVDQCTDGGVCNTSFPHLDLSPEAFNTIADPTVAGVVTTNVRRVACPVQGGVNLRVGSNFFSAISWEILIFNTRMPITAVSFTNAGSTASINLIRQTYNYWRYDGPATVFPVTVTVTDNLGQTVSFQPLTFTSGQISMGTAQLPMPPAIPPAQAQCPTPSSIINSGWIYQDSLSQQYSSINYINTFQWSDWSYNAVVNWAYTINPYDGTNCVQAALSGYGGLQLGTSYSFAWAGQFTSLQFAIRADAPCNIAVSLKTSSTQKVIPVTTTWQLITLNLAADLYAPVTIGGPVSILWANPLSSAIPNIYVDDIRFVPVTSTSTPIPTPGATSSITSSAPSSPSTTAAQSASSASTATTGGRGSSVAPPATSTTASSCNPSTVFPASLNNRQCQGLNQVYGPTSATQCAQAACGTSASVWQWCQPGYSCSPPSSCWTGPSSNCAVTPLSNSGWISQAIRDPAVANSGGSASASTSTSSSSGSGSGGGSTVPSSSSSSTTGSPSSSSNTACAVVVSQTAAGGWTGFTQWKVTITNAGTSNFKNAMLTMNAAQTTRLSQFWSVTQSSPNTFILPSYVSTNSGVPPQGTFEWGYIVSGSESIPFTIVPQC